MESITGTNIPDECKTGWLLVESDFSARLTKPEQLKYALQCAGRNPSEKAIERYWTQCGGSMSFEQFSLVMKKERKATMSDLMKAFRKIDLNGDGYITVQELHKTLTKRGEKMTHDEVQAIIEEADENGDGKLDYAEFCHMLINTSEECVKASCIKSSTTRQTGSRTSQTGFKTGQTSSKHRRNRSRPYPAYQQVGGFAQTVRETHSENVLYDNLSRGDSNYHKGRSKITDKGKHEPLPRSIHLLEHSKEGQAPTSVSWNGETVEQQAVSNSTPYSFAPLSTTNVGTMETGGHQLELVKVPDPDTVGVNHVQAEVKGQMVVHGMSAVNGTPGDLNIHVSNEVPQVASSKSTPISGRNGDAANLTMKLLSDPFDVPSSSVSKLPPLTKTALPPLLPPIGKGGAKGGEEERKKVEDEMIPNKAHQLDHEKEIEKSTDTKDDNGREGTDQNCDNSSSGHEGNDHHQSTPAKSESSPILTDQTFIKGEPQATNRVDVSPLDSKTSLKDTTDSASPTKANPETSNEATKPHEKEESNNTNAHKDEHPPSEVVESSKHEEKERDGSRSEGSKDSQAGQDEEKMGAEEGQQTDHLDKKKEEPPSVSPGLKEVPKSKMAPPSSVVALSPKKPRNLKSWNSITGKGCFYLDQDDETDEEEGVVRCHHYRLKVPSPTNVWIEMGVAKPGIQATDVLLFVFRTNENEEPEELVTYTQHKVEQRWVCRLDLDVGTYALIPFTSGCHLKPREDDIEVGVVLLSQEGGGVALSDGCREALEEIFHRMDLDSNGFLGRTEFDFFQERTSGEICDDESWKVIQDNFEMTDDDELTLKGFSDLHVMTAEDEEGGEGEVWEVLDSLGYNKQLQLDQACPFLMDVYTEDCEGEIEIVDLLPFNSIVDPALCRLVVDRGVCEAVKDGQGELNTYTFITPHISTIVVESKSSKKVSVQLDVSKSTNCVFSRESSVHVLEIPPKSCKGGFHLVPQETNEAYSIKCIASKILC